MKQNKFFAALVAGLAIAACSPKVEEADVEEGEAAVAAQEEVKTAKDFVASKSQRDSVAYLVGVNFGSFIKGYDFGDLSFAQIKKGMIDFIKAEGNMRDPEFGKQFKINPEEMNDLFNNYLEKRHNYKLYSNKEAGEKFLAKNKEKDGVVELESGLQYKVIEAGSELRPVDDKDTVWVRYQGKNLDGKVFDEVKPEADSIRFTLNHVIAGWTEGLKQVGEGGHIQLFIPGKLAYGERGNQGIEPNATLIFDIELCKVAPYVEKEEAAK